MADQRRPVNPLVTFLTRGYAPFCATGTFHVMAHRHAVAEVC